MTTESNSTSQQKPKQKVIRQGATSDAVYGFGLIGALVYYIGHATTFWVGVLGILKAIVWPGMLVFELLKYLHM